MAKNNHFRSAYSKASPEERLKILRHESLRLIGSIRGYVRLLRDLNMQNPRELSDFEVYTKKIEEASDDLLEIVESLTDK
jgi:hypothetical protein